jgi:hypothetical protein
MTIRLPAAISKDLGLKAKAAPVAEVVVADVKPATPAAPEVRVVEVRVAEGLVDAVEALRTAVAKMQPPAPPKRPTGMEMTPKRNAKGQIETVTITFNWND